MNTKTKQTVKKVVDIFLWVFLAFSLVMTILAFSAQASGTGFPKFGKTCLFMVSSNSMEGPNGFYTGDMIVGNVLTEEEKQNLQVGDVISFYLDITPYNGLDDKVLNTHRIIEIIPGETPADVSYRTKGDNNETEDGYTVSTDVIEAKWTGKRIAVLGSLVGFLQSSTGFLVCIIIPLSLFFVYELVFVVLAVMKVKNKDKKMITKAEEEMIKQRAIEEFLARQAAEAAKVSDAQTSEKKNDEV